MKNKSYLDDLIYQGMFRFNHLSIAGVDNDPVVKLFSPAILEQEICLFANVIKNGDAYCQLLHQHLINSMQKHLPLPIARFADGEYAFYNKTLGCNGLYKQAESVKEIERVMPLHITALKYLAVDGLLAPLVFPGNSQTKTKGGLSFFSAKRDSSGADFLDFLNSSGIALASDNYIPFYVVYAYLTSVEFAAAMNGKKICILNSEYNEPACYEWFAGHKSRPEINFVPIPAEYVATKWEEYKNELLNKIPSDTTLCLTGAGVGALLICTDVARTFSIPAIDAGHVLNMMNNRIDKSNGLRLYTIHK